MPDMPILHFWEYWVRQDKYTAKSEMPRDVPLIVHNQGVIDNNQTGTGTMKRSGQTMIEKITILRHIRTGILAATRLTGKRSNQTMKENLRLQAMLGEALVTFQKLEKDKCIQNKTGTSYNLRE